MVKDSSGIQVKGHVKIFDPETNAIYVSKHNAIHYENISIALAESMANQGRGFVYQMVFGNGGTLVDPSGVITYLTPNTVGTNSGLYNQTFAKIVDDSSANNVDPTRNKIETRHTTGTNYTDLLITCLLDYGEKIAGQSAFDNASNPNDTTVFDELGLRSYSPTNHSKLLTHCIFHPVQKSLNRLIQIDYTVRIQSLSGFNEV